MSFFSLINVFLGNNSFFLLSKQITGIVLTSFLFFVLFKINHYDVKKLFRIYLNFAFIIAFIGLFQELSFVLNFKIGYDFSFLPSWNIAPSQTGFLRVNSILPEPAAFCYVIMPAFFASLVSIIKKKYALLEKWKSLIIIIAFLLTFSTVGYIGIIFSLFLLIYNLGKAKYLFLFGLVSFIFVFFLWFNVDDFRLRIGDSFEVMTGEKELEESNLSTFALFSNTLVTYRTFLDSPIFGHGLGSRPLSYDKYIKELVDVNKISRFQNREEGNSLFLRLLSEVGLLGVLLLFYFISKFYLFKRKDVTNYLWIINNSILILFLIRLIRCGHYFNYGFFFFFWMYYFTWKTSRKKKVFYVKEKNN
jgi:O-antigen ligase